MGKEYCSKLHNSTYRLLDGDKLIRDTFKLSDDATHRIQYRVSTLLKEETSPRETPEGDVVITVGPEEDVLEVKEGVYSVPSKGKVYKFLLKAMLFRDFFSEVSVGLHIGEGKSRMCGITSVCAEHFCFEMNYSGPNLDQVIRGDNSSLANDTKSKEMCIYNVMMMQNTPGQLSVPYTSGLLTRESMTEPVRDSRKAIGIMNIFRKRLLDDKPFYPAEIVNVETALGQQGIVNADIKVNNFVMGGIEGRPRMIDFNILLPSSYKDTPGGVEDFTRSPHSPPEYLRGQHCYEMSMTYSLAHTLAHILKSLSDATGNYACVSLHTNMRLSKWISEAYSENISDRPQPYEVAAHILKAFPFNKNVRFSTLLHR